MINSKNCFNYLQLLYELMPRGEERNELADFIRKTRNNCRRGKHYERDVNEFTWRNRIETPHSRIRRNKNTQPDCNTYEISYNDIESEVFNEDN